MVDSPSAPGYVRPDEWEEGKLVRRLSLGLLAAGLMLVAVPSAGNAATQIGETFDPVNSCNTSETLLQSTSPGGKYAAPAAGVITQWSFQTGGTAPTGLKFKVGRFAGSSNFTIVGESAPVNPVTDRLNSYPTRIPVQPGDVIGFFSGSAPTSCWRIDDAYRYHRNLGDVPPGTTAPFIAGLDPLQLDLSALLEPDCDGDGLGDETQDADLSSCVCKGEQATIRGTDGPDEIKGTPARDVVAALAGRDRVSGLAGKDLICGGRGRDALKGGKDKDKLLGQRGADTLKGGGGNDTCKGGKGRDEEKSC